ncbi:MAG: 30S ribosome-binding factor RbfA [candidate division WOR-3 bacterium]|uniref:Ribosome-binding factor A n=1 Tax=candidate division WOR-3 bacterium TaxID=2052148 RepID=A0A7C3IY86_UNCW3|nr:30S ribosome-binding factor RbfA [candidate division WOR-3 bacterium]
MRYRERRVADAIRDIVAEIILKQISDPGVGFVTVTRCSLSRDLRNATVYFSVMGDDAQRQRSLAHLEHARGFIRYQLSRRLKMKFLPELHFALDEVLAQEQRINRLLDEMEGLEPEGEENK